MELRNGRQQNILADGASVHLLHEDALLYAIDAVLENMWDGANVRTRSGSS